jgi:hypothetical protein
MTKHFEEKKLYEIFFMKHDDEVQRGFKVL